MPEAMPPPPGCRGGGVSFGDAVFQIWDFSAVMFYFTAEGDISYRLPNCVEA